MQLSQYAAKAVCPGRRLKTDMAVAAGLYDNREGGADLAESRVHIGVPGPRLRGGPDEVA